MIYEYLPLPSPSSIRLLRLQPGLLPSPVQCLMSTYEIKDGPAFEALSYTWGQKIEHRIGCDNDEGNGIENSGHYIDIHESLWLALQKLRDETKERVMWIDAICISQTDPKERNDQVLLMRELFGRAESIVIWLGEESHDSSAAFTLISRIVSAAASEQANSPVDAKKFIRAQDLGGLALPDHFDPAWKALDSLFWRPWFTRVWVIQEITVAKDAVVICGSSHCQWSHLITTAKYVEDHSLTAITRVDPQRVIKFVDLSQRFREGLPQLLLELLSQARDSYSTDDRDKVFALLGIAADAEYSLLKPNYSKPLVDVYTTLTKHLIERDRSLDVLSAVEDRQFRLKRDREQDKQIEGLEENDLPMDSQLPSWVSDWEVHRPSSPFILHPAFGTMRAAGPTQSICNFSADGLSLFAYGAAFDRVAYVGDSFMESVPASGSLFPEPDMINIRSRTRYAQDAMDFMTEQRVRQWEKMARDLKAYPTGEDILDTFVKTLVAGDASFDGLPRGQLHAYYAAWRKYWRLSGANDPNLIHATYETNTAEEILLASQLLRGQLKAAYGRRFFTTSGKYMGLAQSGVRIGHVVVILHGGKTPYLLQRLGSGGYRFIGECYVHGCMNGEVLNMGLTEEEFAIR